MSKPELIVNKEEVFVLTKSKLERLKRSARNSPLNRARINIHRNDVDIVQEMIIALNKDSVFLPHRHLNKSESFHIIEGEMIIMLFSDAGELTNAIYLNASDTPTETSGQFAEGRYYRLDAPHWHSILPLSELVVFHETTMGPFIPGQHEFAPFITGEDETIKQFYIDSLKMFKDEKKLSKEEA